MKLLFVMTAVVVTAGALLFAGESHKHFILGMSSSFYNSNSNKVQRVLLEIWERPDTQSDRDDVDAGWRTYQKIANTNVKAKVYIVSYLQVKSSLDASEITRLKAIVDNNPGVNMIGTFDIKVTMNELGWEKEPTGPNVLP